MAKTNPIGVRFNKEMLDNLKEDNVAQTPQQALNVYEQCYKETRVDKGETEARDYISGIDPFKDNEGVSVISFNKKSKDGEVVAEYSGRVDKDCLSDLKKIASGEGIKPTGLNSKNKKDTPKPPEGLNGLDLTIWKAENKQQ